jgi:NifU-like protein involved in Fe-S cluster formation
MTAAEQDLMKLYSQRILSLAASIPQVGRLSEADGSAMKRSPLCGSTVTVDVRVEDGKIADFAQDVKACALGQSSASVLGSHVIGMDRAAIERGRDQLRAMIKEDGPTPDAPFEDLEVLKPARDYKNRHASILLAWEATLAAMDEAAEKAEVAGA